VFHIAMQHSLDRGQHLQISGLKVPLLSEMSLKEIFDMQGIFMYTIKQNDDNVKF
jgi:hypothetical protein